MARSLWHHVWIKLHQLRPPGLCWRLPTVFNVDEDTVDNPQRLQKKILDKMQPNSFQQHLNANCMGLSVLLCANLVERCTDSLPTLSKSLCSVAF